jgi:hypothetical protein
MGHDVLLRGMLIGVSQTLPRLGEVSVPEKRGNSLSRGFDFSAQVLAALWHAQPKVEL